MTVEGVKIGDRLGWMRAIRFGLREWEGGSVGSSLFRVPSVSVRRAMFLVFLFRLTHGRFIPAMGGQDKPVGLDIG